VHYFRDNDATGYPWNFGEQFATELGLVNGAVVIESTYGNLEVVAAAGSSLYFYWKSLNGSWSSTGPIPGANNQRGTPGFVQGDYGTPGNFEVAAPNAVAGIDYFWRDNGAPGLPWNRAGNIASSLGQVDDVVMFESTQRTMEIAARVGTNVYSITRDTNFNWGLPIPVAQNASGRPGFIQSKFGTNGNFELVVPLTTGGFATYWRDNDAVFDRTSPWIATLGVATGSPLAYRFGALFESNFGPPPGNLELFGNAGVPNQGTRVDSFYRENVPFPDPVGGLRYIGPIAAIRTH
jgi:hypothetical protein